MAHPHIARSRHPAEMVDRKAEIRLGLVVLSTDLTSEGDLNRLLPLDDVSIHVTRVPFENPTTPDNLRKMAPRLTDAANLLPPNETLRAICYSCTAASVSIGDDAVASALHQARPGVPVVTPTLAARWAFAALGVERIAILTPYLERTTEPMVTHFMDQGLTVTGAECFGFEDDRDMARISVPSIVAAAEAVDTSEAEAIFISCTALPAVDAIDAIEDRTGKPVVTSNQACAWALARLGGLVDYHPAGFGRLFGCPLVQPRSGGMD